MKTARQVVEPTVMAAGTRKQIEDDLQIKEFGKWALLGDALGQDIKRQLQYSPRIKESMIEWQALAVMDDDTALKFDRMMTAELSSQQRKVLKSVYQYCRSPEATARIMMMTNWQVRTVRDGALNALMECRIKYFR